MFTSSADSGSNQQVGATKTSLKLKEAVEVKRIVGMNELSESKEQDSFLYYSAPEVLCAKMLQEDIDTFQVDAQPQLVVQKSRISFECHPNLLWEEDGLLDSDPDDDS